ncbi:MAG: hypothetical protein JWO68_3648 [Actinomycetia bacterium]|nr:hypothetical protein [Actinomycetes bacterium]
MPHLVRRFFGSLRPGGPAAVDEAWARSHLLAGEQELWARMSGADRRHAAGVARRVVADLGATASRPVVAAALLHDSGKVASGLGTFARVGATLVGAAVGRDRPGGRVGRYLRHPQLGAALLAEAGSDPLTVAWAAEHHLPPVGWTLPPELARALSAADDD